MDTTDSCPVEWLEVRIVQIESDDSIPVRGQKGTMSKKQVRDEVGPSTGPVDMQAHESAKEDLKEASFKSKWTMGKW